MSATKDIAKRSEDMVEKSKGLPILTPLVDVYENEDEILLHADMPGVKKDDISVNIDNGKLEISGLRKVDPIGAESWQEFGEAEFRRGFSVPQSIDVSKIDAELKEGVLRLHLPKAESAKPKSIEIRTA